MRLAEINLVVPKDRVGVLIGPDGGVKKRIETELQVDIAIDSSVGSVKIVEKSGAGAINILKAKEVVTAIAHGFSPEKSFKLFDEDRIIDVIDLRQIFGRNESQTSRIKGRIIGREGKSRRLIEEALGVSVSVYGHTVSLIGGFETAGIAREALQMLIDGKQHASVFKFLRVKQAELKKKSKTELWQKPV